jgi:hypothetical protein
MENNVESGKSRTEVPTKPENDEENHKKDGRSKRQVFKIRAFHTSSVRDLFLLLQAYNKPRDSF